MTAPVPFIVCHPRSGSTLLRLMLDAHPDMAIPPETMFNEVFRLSRAPPPAAELPGAVVALITGSQRWRDLHLAADELRDAFARLGGGFTIAEGLRVCYRLYAARHGKTRYGDKTPGHIFWLPEIMSLLPEAVIVHIVRDGRDIAASMRPMWFGPGNDMTKLAESWLRSLEAGFAAKRDHPDRYLEIRYEELAAEPEPLLRHVAARIDLPYDPAMLRYPGRAAERLAELRDIYRPDGVLFATGEAHQAIHRRTLEAPNSDRVGRHRDDLSDAERAAFEAIAGPMLAHLGYRA